MASKIKSADKRIKFNFVVAFWLAALFLVACGPSSPGSRTPSAAPAVSELSQPTPAALTPSVPPSAAGMATIPAMNCTNPAPLTPSMTEGPYFTPGSPERASLLEPGISGTKLELSGYVLTSDCQPVANALLDFWQANAQGQYDNNGYTLRGHQLSDANGYYQLETIVPGFYPGRTEHIHVKVQAPNGPLLTTQLYFPGVTDNETDAIFDPHLLMDVQQGSNVWTATFNFVIKTQ